MELIAVFHVMMDALNVIQMEHALNVKATQFY